MDNAAARAASVPAPRSHPTTAGKRAVLWHTYPIGRISGKVSMGRGAGQIAQGRRADLAVLGTVEGKV
jgi:hypothetical protein